MTDDWPLSFFHVKENSIIYLERIDFDPQVIKFRKQLSSKSKYFKSLGLLPTLGTIVESKNEDKESILNKGKKKGEYNDHSESFSSNELMEILLQVNKTNYLRPSKTMMCYK